MKACFMGFMVIFLVGCATHQDDLVQQEKRSCVKMCETRLSTCAQVCDKSCADCAHGANQTMRDRYQGYTHDRYVQGRAVTRQLQSYRDPLQCRKTTCNCMADYRVCAEACSGKIHKRLQVAKTCC